VGAHSEKERADAGKMGLEGGEEEAGKPESPGVATRARYLETGDQLPAVVVGVAG
jgi:hypothetical protein